MCCLLVNRRPIRHIVHPFQDVRAICECSLSQKYDSIGGTLIANLIKEFKPVWKDFEVKHFHRIICNFRTNHIQLVIKKGPAFENLLRPEYQSNDIENCLV